MEHIKNILIAVELDRDSEIILEYGITLAMMLDANVRCIHVVRPISNRIPYSEDVMVENYGEYMLDDEQSVDDDITSGIDRVRNMVSTVLQKMDVNEFPITINVIPDFAIDGILKEAQKNNADLIVVGSHIDFKKGNNAVSNLSKKIIDEANQSVIVVPNTYGNRNLDHVCMFINFEFEELNMIKDMIDVVRWNGMHLSFVHILAEDEEVEQVESKLEVYRRLFLENADDRFINFRCVEGALKDIIDDLSNDMEVDLIGLRFKKKAWKLFKMESTFEEKVMHHIRVPLYIWR